MGLSFRFQEALAHVGARPEISERLWQEVTTAHSANGRHYHTIEHLESMALQLEPFRGDLQDPDAITLAIAYHDFIYRVTRSDNEAESARRMKERMMALGLSPERIERIEQHILATKAHQATTDPDTAYLTDADLSILGASPDAYDEYTRAIRKEYRRYPDLLYRPGRRKVLEHFLAMPRIYHTQQFYAQFEDAARRNLEWELQRL